MALDAADSASRDLLAHVRPPDWRAPVARPRYDLVVIGGGTAGLVTAIGAAVLGADVALVERDRLGGDCLNTGCVPSKALLASGHVAATVAGAAEYGVPAPPSRVDFAAVMARGRQVRTTLAAHDSAARAAAAGVHVFYGHAVFTGRDVVTVDDTRLRFRRAVIATGARPAPSAVEGLEGPQVFTTDSVFDSTAQPRRLAVLGGGPVGCELAQAFARLGSRVHLLEAGARLLPREDGDAAELIRDALTRDGVRVLTATTAHHAASQEGTWRLTIARGSIGDVLDVDAVLVAVGRRPDTGGLGLDLAGVTTGAEGRIVVNDFLQTANPRVYAAGDVCLPSQFTHAADASARLVVRNALFAGRGRVSRLLIPRVTYTDPEVAAVGLTLDGAAAAGARTSRIEVPFAEVDRAVTDGRVTGFARLLTVHGRDRIVGATVVGARAGEIMGEVVLAMQTGVGLRRLATIVRAYPTYGGVIGRAADAYNRTRLTPRVARMLKTWIAVTRRLPGA